MKKWLAGAGVATAGLAALGVASYVLTKDLVSVAVDRECPPVYANKARKKFVSTEQKEAFVMHMRTTGQKLRQAESKTVTVTARDGAKLVGHWVSCDDPKRVVIAMHGWRSNWAQCFGMVADFLRSNHCCVLYVEQRGQGKSGGEYMGLGALERYDCQSWARWTAGVTELPIYLVGVSMGATTALMASALELPEQVKGIIADCGFTSPEAIGKHLVQNTLHMPYHLHAAAADAMCRRKNQVGIRGNSAADALKKCKLPVLFVHGTEDMIVPVTMTYENYQACAGPKELLIVPGADHGMSYYVDQQRYEAALLAFWRKYDG